MVLGKPLSDPTTEWFIMHSHKRKYPAKSTIIHEGEKADTLYYVISGSVAVLIKDEEGKEMILSYLNKGDFIGELGLFDESEDPRRTAFWLTSLTLLPILTECRLRLPDRKSVRSLAVQEKPLVGSLRCLKIRVIFPHTERQSWCTELDNLNPD